MTDACSESKRYPRGNAGLAQAIGCAKQEALKHNQSLAVFAVPSASTAKRVGVCPEASQVEIRKDSYYTVLDAKDAGLTPKVYVTTMFLYECVGLYIEKGNLLMKSVKKEDYVIVEAKAGESENQVSDRLLDGAKKMIWRKEDTHQCISAELVEVLFAP